MIAAVIFNGAPAARAFSATPLETADFSAMLISKLPLIYLPQPNQATLNPATGVMPCQFNPCSDLKRPQHSTPFSLGVVYDKANARRLRKGTGHSLFQQFGGENAPTYP